MFSTYRDVQCAALCAAILVYALWGEPTPPVFGWTEMVVGVLLAVAVGFRSFARAVTPVRGDPHPFWFRAGQIFLLYGLSVPLVGAVMVGASPGNIVRDVVPFLFMLLPVFMIDVVRDRVRWHFIVTACVVALGVLFAARVVAPLVLANAGIDHAAQLGLNMSGQDPRRLANAPSVLFAAMAMLGVAGVMITRRVNVNSVIVAATLAALALVPLAAMALVLQRASLGLLALGVVFWIGIGIVKKPRRMVVPLLGLAVLCLAVWAPLSDVVAGLAHKNVMVGANMRWQEAAAVRDALHGIGAVLFGNGWGATVQSPAVGDSVVTFTHNLGTTLWLKSGLIGVGLGLAYFGGLALALIRFLPVHPILAVALGAPMVIDYLLYASFKSLDFGLILLLAALYSARTAAAAPGGQPGNPVVFKTIPNNADF
ncbi:hypothetical protein [Micavibrio aeruginosavorus]|uniref:hypothetical protein n=1 Tax=Micavibrio aeruginosavorus TaxID=349221 RepID=UPI003F4AA86A